MYFIYVMIGLEESRVRLNVLCLCCHLSFFVITVCHLNINILNRVVSLYCPPIIVKK